jgi:hypothetical protein
MMPSLANTVDEEFSPFHFARESPKPVSQCEDVRCQNA